MQHNRVVNDIIHNDIVPGSGKPGHGMIDTCDDLVADRSHANFREPSTSFLRYPQFTHRWRRIEPCVPGKELWRKPLNEMIDAGVLILLAQMIPAVLILTSCWVCGSKS